MNPFIIKGYLSPKYFCDREKETARILGAISNQRNLTLVSLRKMGKTGLIFHVFNELKHLQTHETLYLDIYHTDNLSGLINQLGTGISFITQVTLFTNLPAPLSACKMEFR